jgi:chromosome segregation ATPase
MRLLRAGFLGAVIAEQAIANKNIQGVIKMLQGLLTNAETEATEGAEVYDKVACSCRDNMRDYTHQFEVAQKDKDELNVILTELKGKSADLAHVLAKHLDVFEQAQAKVTAKQAETVALATTMGAEQKADADSTELAMLETINQPYLISEIKRLTTDIDTKEAERQMRVAKCDEMIEACDKVLGHLKGTQGKTIIDMVKSLRKQAFDKKSSIQTGENEVQKQIHDLEQERNAAQTYLEISKENSNKRAAKKAKVDAEIADTKARIADRTTEIMTLKDDISTTNEKCKEAAVAWDEAKALSEQEITALSKAIDSLKTVPGAVEPPAEFVQVVSSSKGAKARVDNAISLITTSASMSHSPVLAALALKMRVSVGGVDYFKSIRQMIVDMVSRLEQEQAAETSKTDWCAETLKELKTDKTNKQTDYDDAVTAVKTGQELIKETKQTRNEKKAEKKEAEKTKAELEEVLASKVQLNEEILTEKRASIKGIDGAIVVLQDAFAGEGQEARQSAASTQVKTRANTGATIINLLKKILQEEKDEAEIANMEVQCKSTETYKPLTEAPDAPCSGGYVYAGGEKHAPSTTFETVELIEEKDNDIKELTGTIEKLTNTLSDAKVQLDQDLDDQDAKDGLLDTAKKSLKARQEACVNAGDSFEARAKRRKEEMAALKEALQILEEHSGNSERGAAASFLQMRTA